MTAPLVQHGEAPFSPVLDRDDEAAPRATRERAQGAPHGPRGAAGLLLRLRGLRQRRVQPVAPPDPQPPEVFPNARGARAAEDPPEVLELGRREGPNFPSARTERWVSLSRRLPPGTVLSRASSRPPESRTMSTHIVSGPCLMPAAATAKLAARSSRASGSLIRPRFPARLRGDASRCGRVDH